MKYIRVDVEKDDIIFLPLKKLRVVHDGVGNWWSLMAYTEEHAGGEVVGVFDSKKNAINAAKKVLGGDFADLVPVKGLVKT